MTSIDPSSRFVAVTPTDNVVLLYNGVSERAKGFSCAVAGNIAVKNDLGTAITIAILAGAIYPISSDTVMSTNTTATGIIAYF